MNSLIEVKGLRKEFNLKGTKNVLVAVDDVDVSIRPCQTYGLIGESGSGKTTVGRILLRLLQPTAGVLKFNDLPYHNLGPSKFKPVLKQMQMVFQDPYYSLNPNRTVWDTVYGACNKTGGERKRLVKEALQMVQIDEDFYDKYPHQISMGQQQRVGIARAIVSKPRFIVLDEPTSSLDLTVRGEIISLLVQLQKELDISYLFISHDLSTIRHMCHKVSVMYLGQIVETGTAEQIFDQSSHPYSKALLSSVMVPNPDIKRNNYILKGEIPSPVNLPNHCYLANRCPEATEICYREKPPVKEIEPEHTVRCHRR